MSTFSKNPFDLLGEDEEAPVQKQEQKAPQKTETKKAAPRAKTDNQRNARGGARSDDRSSAPRFSRRTDDSGNVGGEFPRASRGNRAAHRGRVPGRGRQFDRHSGTGLVDSEKKETVGWGNATTAQEEGKAVAEADAKEAAAEDAEVATPVEEPEEKVKTLDEYLTERANKNLNISLPEARQPNEGADDAKWKNSTLLEKDEEDDFIAGKEQSFRQRNKAGKKEKVFVDIEQRFQERSERGGRRDFNERRGGGERGRGSGSDRRGRGRGGRRGGANVNLNDASAFPTLGAQ